MATSLKDQFDHIEFIVKAIAEGKRPGMIICGPPGWGKTFTVRNVLKQIDIDPPFVTINNEHAFVQTLYTYRHAPVIVADDTDQLALRPTCLNIAKGAFGPDHTVIWESRAAQKLGLERFKIKGGLIWISNRDYTDSKSRREDLQAHWGALESRGILPIWLDTTDQEDAFRYVVRLACTSPEMWHLKQPLNKAESEEVMRWFCAYRNRLLEISPRAIKHVIDAFHLARNDIKQREHILAELVTPNTDAAYDFDSGKWSPMNMRNLAKIVPPTIVRKDIWRDVP
jgi:hypothetical protein